MKENAAASIGSHRMVSALNIRRKTIFLFYEIVERCKLEKGWRLYIFRAFPGSAA